MQELACNSISRRTNEQLRDFYEVWGKIAKVREGKALSSKKSTMFSCLGHSGKLARHSRNEWERKDPSKTRFSLLKQGKKMNLTRWLQLSNTTSQGIFGNFHLTTSYFYDENSILGPISKFQKFDSIALYIINFSSVQCAASDLDSSQVCHA